MTLPRRWALAVAKNVQDIFDEEGCDHVKGDEDTLHGR